jgi:3-hydroxyacyl-CoA dehydrogenase
VEQGAATAQEVDEAMGRDGFGWPMGPFFLMDMLGIDVCAHVGQYLYGHYGERLAEVKLFDELVNANRLGEKTGAGFYIYAATDAEPLEAIVQRLQETGELETGTSFSVDRLMMPFFNEAALCAQEDIANVNDIDMACIAGIGMQVNQNGELVRMGPLEYMDQVGLDVILEKLEALQQEFGSRFQPADIISQKVRNGNLGKKAGYGFKEYTA